jgi:hypothetical protein
MSDQRPTTSDPTPEERTGDSSIKPAVIGFIVTILIILVAALIFIRVRQTKVIPKATDDHPTSRIISPPAPTQLPVPVTSAA